MQTMGLNGVAKGLLAGAGLSAFIFGFAFKDIAENFLGGLILAFNRPFSLNDTIQIRDFTGHVKALNFRTTHIKTFDEKDVFYGKVFEVVETGANDVYWIKEPNEILIPAIDEIIISVDISENKIVIKPLIEWNYEN